MDLCRGASLWFRKERGEFEVDQTKPTVGLAVGDIAELGVVMTNAVELQFREEFPEPGIVDALDALAAVGRDDAEFGLIRFQKARNKRAGAFFQMPEDPNLIGEPHARIRPVIGLEDPSIETQMDRCPERVFDLEHVDFGGIDGSAPSAVCSRIHRTEPATTWADLDRLRQRMQRVGIYGHIVVN